MAKAMIKKTDRQKTEEENKKKNKYADEEKQKLSFREWMKQQQQQQHSLSHSWAMSGRSWSRNSSCCWRESHANTAREKEKKRIPSIIATEKRRERKEKILLPTAATLYLMRHLSEKRKTGKVRERISQLVKLENRQQQQPPKKN